MSIRISTLKLNTGCIYALDTYAHPFPSANYVQMWLQSYAATTTLQKGGGEIEKEQNFPLFQGFCLSVVSNA